MSELPINRSFAYEAQTPEGQPISGTIDAPEIGRAGEILAAMRLRVLNLAAVASAARARPLGGDQFLAFNQQLAQLTAAGLPVEHGLRLIAKDMRSGRLSRTVGDVVSELEKGTPLDQAFEHHAGKFPPLYGRLIALGIRSGNLSGILLNLGRHLDLVTRLRAMLWRAVSYPMMVIVALCLIMLFLAQTVIPQFEGMYRDFGVQLPTITVAILATPKWLPAVTIAILAIVVFGPLFWRLMRAMGADRPLVDHVLLRLPLVGPVLRQNLIARWCDAMQMGVQAGLDLPAAVEMASDAVGSPSLKRDGEKIIATLAAGRSLEETPPTRILPATVIAAMGLAGASNTLPGMLANLSAMYQQQAETRLGMVPGALTPLLIILVAAMIGMVVLGLFMPMVSLVQNLS